MAKPAASFRSKSSKRSRKHSRSSKGAAYEREICRRLSLWVSDLAREDLFWRSSMSGGRFTQQRNRKQKALATTQAGDISAMDGEGAQLLALFTVEVKFYADLQTQHLTLQNRGKTVRFWKQANDQTLPPKLPMLFAKQNYAGQFLCVSRAGLQLLRLGRRRGRSLEPRAIFPKLDLYLFDAGLVLSVVNFKTMLRKARRLSERLKEGDFQDSSGAQTLWPFEDRLGDLLLHL